MSPGPEVPDPAVRFRYVLRLADTNLVLAQRLCEWIGHAPALEEELGLANITLDLLGRARSLLTYAGELEGRGRSEDDLAYLRGPGEFLNATLAEQPNRDFAAAIVRQVLLDAFQMALFEGLASSRDPRLAEIASKSLTESRYHFRYGAGWLARLADGTAESRRRVIAALDELGRFADELCAGDEVDEAMAAAGHAPHPFEVEARWAALIGGALCEATLDPPAKPPRSIPAPYGRRGEHSEHLEPLLAELQSLRRAYPGARW
ncbi:MAG: 1,2-phenylacetyl-CoA epoxidase subunit PaaC [Steroidobacteraceae bacterium]